MINLGKMEGWTLTQCDSKVTLPFKDDILSSSDFFTDMVQHGNRMKFAKTIALKSYRILRKFTNPIAPLIGKPHATWITVFLKAFSKLGCETRSHRWSKLKLMKDRAFLGPYYMVGLRSNVCKQNDLNRHNPWAGRHIPGCALHHSCKRWQAQWLSVSGSVRLWPLGWLMLSYLLRRQVSVEVL